MAIGEVGIVRKIDIDHEMQQAYLDYAMSVIISRALPDARDGLKPVHRRILYAMYDMGLQPGSVYKKSARIVGEVLGKYHPHSDMAVYDSMARMAQDFSMRYPLVDGQGNFGSMDGDSPAAMRYTEAKLAPISTLLLTDIQKNTIDFSDNFDGTLKEPDTLPSALPNLLLNGATGIAVGMATSIPPHNLGEVIQALVYMLDHWHSLDDISVEQLMGFVKGPDFPTGGLILEESEDETLASAYGTGRGRVIVRARAQLEQLDRGRSQIIVTELPYMTNKSALIERIADLVRDGKLDGITDLRDESDRHGMRIVIELNKTADPDKILRDLYKNTPMQSTFSIIMLALVDGEPRMLSLKQALRVYLEHRLVVIRRRSVYDLEKAIHRAHILEGLRIALQNIDEVINLIRHSPDVETARQRLMKRFKLSEEQTQAILDMPLRRLASLERKKIDEEFKEVQALIKFLEGLLKSPEKMRAQVAEELQDVSSLYSDRRRTQIVTLKAGDSLTSVLTAADMAPSESAWVTVTKDGLISRTVDEGLPRLSGNAAPAWVIEVNTRDILYLVAEDGQAATVAVHSLPQVEHPEDGVAYNRISVLRGSERLAALFNLPPASTIDPEWNVVTMTRQGMVKKTAVTELPGLLGKPFTLVKVNEGDRLGFVRLSSGQGDFLIVTGSGMAIRFNEDSVRPMGLVAAGVLAMKLQGSDEVAGFEVLPAEGELFMVTAQGRGKRVDTGQFPVQGRYGQGVLAWKLPGKDRIVGVVIGRGTTKITLMLKRMAPKSVRLDAAPLQGRSANGKLVLELKDTDEIVDVNLPLSLPRPEKGTAVPKAKRASPRRSLEMEVEQMSFLDEGAPASKPAQETTSKAGVKQAITPKTRGKTSQKETTGGVKSAGGGKSTGGQATTGSKKAPASSAKSAGGGTKAKTAAAEKKPSVPKAKPSGSKPATGTTTAKAAPKPAAKPSSTARSKSSASKPKASGAKSGKSKPAAESTIPTRGRPKKAGE